MLAEESRQLSLPSNVSLANSCHFDSTDDLRAQTRPASERPWTSTSQPSRIDGLACQRMRHSWTKMRRNRFNNDYMFSRPTLTNHFMGRQLYRKLSQITIFN